MSDRPRSVAHLALLVLAALAGAWTLDRLRAGLGPDDVRWLVSPAVGLVEIAGGGPFEWEPGEGFLVRAARLHVTAECAGVRFLLVSAALLALAWTGGGGARPRVRGLLLATSTAFVVTTLANALRLAVALRLDGADLGAAGWSFEEAHRATSLALYGAAFLLLVVLGRSAAVRAWVRGEPAPRVRGSTSPAA